MIASGNAADACVRYVTSNYVRTAFGDRRGCLAAQQPGSFAGSVSVSAIAVRSDRARATAVPAGGPSDGERIKVELVLQGWRLEGGLAALRLPGGAVEPQKRWPLRDHLHDDRPLARAVVEVDQDQLLPGAQREAALAIGTASEGPITEARWWAWELVSWLSRLCS